MMEDKTIAKTIGKLVLIVVAAMICIGVGLTMFTKSNQDDKVMVEETKQTYVEPERYNVDMFMVADAMIPTNTNEDMLETLKPILSGYDLAYCSQEGYNQTFATYMKDLGFNMTNLANEDIIEDEQEILSALDYYQAQDNVYYTGCAKSQEERDNYQIFDINNIRFGFIGYTYDEDQEIEKGKEYLVNIYDDETLVKDITNLRSQVDVLIVAMNWEENPTLQQHLAHLLADNGVDVIIGSQEDSIQPVEWIDDTICFYSLGSMLDEDIDKQIGMMGSIKITKSVLGDKVDITISQPKADLIYTDKNSSKGNAGYKLYTFDELTDEILPNYQEVYQEYTKVINQLDDSIIVGNIK